MKKMKNQPIGSLLSVPLILLIAIIGFAIIYVPKLIPKALPNRLEVIRISTLPENHMINSDYFDKTIVNVQLVQQIYVHIQNLPVPPKGVFLHCPADFGISYTLRFFHNSALMLQTTANPNGCQRVNGHIPNDTFWKLLAKGLNMPVPKLFPSFQ